MITISDRCLTASLVPGSLQQIGPQNRLPVRLHVQRPQRGNYEQCQSMFKYQGQIGRGPTAVDVPFDFHFRNRHQLIEDMVLLWPIPGLNRRR